MPRRRKNPPQLEVHPEITDEASHVEPGAVARESNAVVPEQPAPGLGTSGLSADKVTVSIRPLIRAIVSIPEVTKFEFDKVGINKEGKLTTKISFEVEDIAEVSLFRIVHMLNQKVRVFINIGADKLQSDFLDLVDPVVRDRVLAKVTPADLMLGGILNKLEQPAPVTPGGNGTEEKGKGKDEPHIDRVGEQPATAAS